MISYQYDKYIITTIWVHRQTVLSKQRIIKMRIVIMGVHHATLVIQRHQKQMEIIKRLIINHLNLRIHSPRNMTVIIRIKILCLSFKGVTYSILIPLE